MDGCFPGLGPPAAGPPAEAEGRRAGKTQAGCGETYIYTKTDPNADSDT